jgi:thymidylate synthase (FAD)
MKINVLDKGYVEYVDHLGSDLSVVNAARVSFDRVSPVLNQSDEKLIAFLARHGHWSPFAHVHLTVRIRAPISVQRQYMKHRVGVENNSESTRYVVMKPEFYVPTFLRTQSKDVKQGSDGLMNHEDEDHYKDRINEHYEAAYALYTDMVAEGAAREQARDILPLATYTTWISTMSLYAAARIFNQRTKGGAQAEIEEYAVAIGEIAYKYFPVSWEALVNA